MKSYCKDMGRIAVSYHDARGDTMAVAVSVRTGWNASCPFHENVLSVEEARDLRYLLDRVIAHAESPHAP